MPNMFRWENLRVTDENSLYCVDDAAERRGQIDFVGEGEKLKQAGDPFNILLPLKFGGARL